MSADDDRIERVDREKSKVSMRLFGPLKRRSKINYENFEDDKEMTTHRCRASPVSSMDPVVENEPMCLTFADGANRSTPSRPVATSTTQEPSRAELARLSIEKDKLKERVSELEALLKAMDNEQLKQRVCELERLLALSREASSPHSMAERVRREVEREFRERRVVELTRDMPEESAAAVLDSDVRARSASEPPTVLAPPPTTEQPAAEPLHATHDAHKPPLSSLPAKLPPPPVQQQSHRLTPVQPSPPMQPSLAQQLPTAAPPLPPAAEPAPTKQPPKPAAKLAAKPTPAPPSATPPPPSSSQPSSAAPPATPATTSVVAPRDLSPFVGKWGIVQEEGKNAYLNALDMSFVVRKAAKAMATPPIRFSLDERQRTLTSSQGPVLGKMISSTHPPEVTTTEVKSQLGTQRMVSRWEDEKGCAVLHCRTTTNGKADVADQRSRVVVDAQSKRPRLVVETHLTKAPGAETVVYTRTYEPLRK